MNHICPNCNNQLYKVNSKLICGNEKCDFHCIVSNYNNESQPWNIKLCKDTAFWNETVFEQYPFILAKEYKRIFTLLEKNKLYGVIFQIKDMFEVILKLPTLLVLNELCSNKNRNKAEDETLQFFLSKMLSLGDWHVLAKKCLASCSSTNLKKILGDITRVFDKSAIVNWRNDTLGHGALMFDDTKEFREDLEGKLKTIKKHFEECEEQYLQIALNYKMNENTIELKGSNLDNDIFRLDGSLMLVESKKSIKINELIKVYNSNVFFFDSFCQWDNKTKMLCYLDAQIIKLKLNYFDEMFKNSVKYNAVNNETYSSKLHDEIYTETEENMIKIISNQANEVIVPDFLFEWVNDNLKKSNNGLYLIQMEKGMGKTTFSKALDPHTYSKKKFDNTVTRVYYVNSTYSYKVTSFENDFVELLKLNDDKTNRFKGDIPKFNNQPEIRACSHRRLSNVCKCEI